MSEPTFKLDPLEHGKRALGLVIWALRAGKYSRPHLAELTKIDRERMLHIELGQGDVPSDAELRAIADALETSPDPWLEKAKTLREAVA